MDVLIIPKAVLHSGENQGKILSIGFTYSCRLSTLGQIPYLWRIFSEQVPRLKRSLPTIKGSIGRLFAAIAVSPAQGRNDRRPHKKGARRQ
jgi:hypothetical protein